MFFDVSFNKCSLRFFVDLVNPMIKLIGKTTKLDVKGKSCICFFIHNLLDSLMNLNESYIDNNKDI